MFTFHVMRLITNSPQVQVFCYFKFIFRLLHTWFEMNIHKKKLRDSLTFYYLFRSISLIGGKDIIKYFHGGILC